MLRARSALVHVGIVCIYAALAVLYSWPLVFQLGTHITGSPEGDAAAYVWNQWVFRREAAEGHAWAFRTASILSLTTPADLSLHNYTVFADLLSLVLQRWLGLVASFNLVYLVLHVSSAYAMFLLARSVVGRVPEAALAGMLFGFSPFLAARGTAHYSLVAAAPLPLFVLFAGRAGATRRWTWAVAAGATMAWSAYCDPYYLVFCFAILIAGLVHMTVRFSFERRAAAAERPRLARALEAAAVLLAVLVTAIALTGGGRFRVAGLEVSAKTIYTPVLILLSVLLVRLCLAFRPRVALRPEARVGTLARLLVWGEATCLVLLLPLLLPLARRLNEGRLMVPEILWRSSPRGVDALALLMPNPSHALFGEPFRSWLARYRADGFVENAASLTLTAIVVVGLAVWRRIELPRAWVAFTVFFVALALGPFVTIGGFNTALPTPWTLLRYAPGVGLVHSPTRFAIVAMLGFAVLFAVALRELASRAGVGRTVVLALVAAILGWELAPSPRALHAATMPAFFDLIARDPCPVRVLELPFGLRDGTRSIGNFSARTQFHQTRHCKPLLGGYLSRISERRVRDYKRMAVASVLMKLSADEPVSFEEAEEARRGARSFVRGARIGFVVVDHSRTSRKLRRFAYNAFQLESIAQEGRFELLAPRASLCANGQKGRGCGHGAPGCLVGPRSAWPTAGPPGPLVAAAGPTTRSRTQGMSISDASERERRERSIGRVGPRER